MKKKLTTSGNGWILYFSKPLLKLLGYNPKETKVLITVKIKTLYIEEVKPENLEKYSNKMIRRFQKSGSSYGLYFPNPIMDILEINPETDFLDIEIDENKLSVTKAN